jgi:hypothetical protein
MHFLTCDLAAATVPIAESMTEAVSAFVDELHRIPAQSWSDSPVLLSHVELLLPWLPCMRGLSFNHAPVMGSIAKHTGLLQLLLLLFVHSQLTPATAGPSFTKAQAQQVPRNHRRSRPNAAQNMRTCSSRSTSRQCQACSVQRRNLPQFDELLACDTRVFSTLEHGVACDVCCALARACCSPVRVHTQATCAHSRYRRFCTKIWRKRSTSCASITMRLKFSSSSLALPVALWGMTSGRTLQAMRHGMKQTEAMRVIMLWGEA